MVSGAGATLTLLLLLGGAAAAAAGARYFGKELGALSELHHGVRGRVFAVDARTLYLQDFHYDGEGPAAFFIVGSGGAVGAEGARRLRDERGAAGPLRRYRGESVTLSLPEGSTLKDLRWFSVWCDEYSVDFGSVAIPRALEAPRPARLGALRGVHGVASDAVVVVDAQTLLVPNFSYDGEAPDAKFWVGRGEKPSPQGIRIPDENGKEAPLRRYERKTIVLTLPGELTVFDIGHFGVWCEAFTVDFGHVALPHDQLANVPPSLKMLGVSPQSKLNCEVLLDELAFEVRWAVAGDSIVLQLVAKLEEGEYMSFGVSGAAEHSQMVGGDVVVAWVDKRTLKGYAHDYYLDAKSQCAGVRGSCPDERLGERTNSVRLLNAALVNGYSIVTYQRPLRAADELDRAVLTNASQPVLWALGPLNERDEVSYHHHFTKGDKFIEFGRPPVWNCPMPEGEEEQPTTATPPRAPAAPVARNETALPSRGRPVPPPRPAPPATAWEIPGIECDEPADGVFYAQMGPTGGRQGYPAITGHVGWGISWYINGLLIPEVTVVRGKKYTFVVEGGADPETPARYHPFYITDDPVGGYFHKSDEEKQAVRVLAGARRGRGGALQPTGVGRLCSWTPDAAGPPADDYPSFGAYQRSLTLVCEEGSPGVVTWTPDEHTPDTVYYQCFTHRHLGWKIHVVDECAAGAESRVAVSAVRAPAPGDLQGQESAQVERRAPPPPSGNALDRRTKIEKIINTKTNYNDFSSDKSVVGLTGEIYGPEADLNQLYPQEHEAAITQGELRDVIRAVEGLESGLRARAPPPQYQVHEDVREPAPPRTLQAVLRPGARPPQRRPAPPDFPVRRPQPQPQHAMYQKHGGGYPLALPGSYGPHGPPGAQKKPYNKPAHFRVPPGMNRSPGGPPMKPTPPLYLAKPAGQGPPKQRPPSSTQQTLGLGRTDVIASHVVKSHITLPGGSDALAQASVSPSFLQYQDQIILGKPMDHPQPLEQPTPPRSSTPVAPRTTAPAPSRAPLPPADVSFSESDFLGESAEGATLRPAVNTGFQPNSIVVESGFKPIIREPLMERAPAGASRREDTDVADDDEYEDEQQQPVPAAAATAAAVTHSFEPMFIPSPLDRVLPTDDRTKEVFPSNHAKEDRPHPVYVQAQSLFSEQNMRREPPAHMAMESDRLSAQYLPPDPKLPEEHSQKLSSGDDTFTTYDGKTVSGATLVSVPAPQGAGAGLPAGAALLQTPQFGPFKGETPPPVAERAADLAAAPSERRDVHAPPAGDPADDGDDGDGDDDDDDDEDEDDDSEDREGDGRRSRRDVGAARLERARADAQTRSEFNPHTAASGSTKVCWTNLVLLAVCFKFLY